MTESNPVQVTLSDDGLKIIKVQDAANTATKGVTNLNDPNMMSVIEKQSVRVNFAGQTSRYNVMLQRAKDDGISTTALESAYTNLNNFMNTVIADGTKASDVDRDKYSEALSEFTNQMSLMQNALQNSFDKAISSMQSNVAAASQVASQAVITATSAEAVGNQASESASVAQKAGQAASDAYDKLKISNRNLALMTGPGFIDTGSNADVWLDDDALKVSDPVWVSFDWTVEKAGAWRLNQVQNVNGVGVWHDIFADSNRNEIDIVTNQLSGHFSGLIYWYPIQSGATNVHLHVTQSISVGKVTIKNFILSNSSKEVMYTPAETVLSNAVIGNAQIKDASINTAKISELSANKLSAGTIDANVITVKNLNASNITTGKIGADKLDVGQLSAVTSDLGQVTAGDIKGVSIEAKTFSTPNSTFTVDENGNITATSLSLLGNKNCVYNSELLGNAAGWYLANGGHVVNNLAHAGTLGLNWNSTTNGANWVQSASSKLMPVNYSNDRAFSASAWLLVRQATKGTVFNLALRFWDSSLKQVGAEGANYTSDGNYHDWSLVTVENLVMPSTASYVSIDYNAYNGSGDFTFSQPMINQGAHYQGYTSDTGNVLSGGQVILDTDGTLTTNYTGIAQDNDNYYSAWTLSNGTLSIGKGYITSTATGSRVVSNVPQSPATVKGTLTASYLKFTQPNIPARTYLDATHFTVSSNNTSDIVTIDRTGVSLQNGAALNGPVFNWSGGGVQSQNLIMGLSPHTINTTDKHEIGFQIGRGNTGKYAIIHVASVVTASQLSKKKEVVPYIDSGNVVANTNLATYRYDQEDNTDTTHVGPIIDNTNTNKKWFISPEIISTSGELGGAEIDLPASIFYGWSAIKALQRENENLQIRLRKLEIEGA